MEKMKNIIFRVEPEIRKEFKRLVNYEGKSMQSVLKTFVVSYIERNKHRNAKA